MGWSSEGSAEAVLTAPRDGVWFDRLFVDHAASVHRYFARRAPRQDCHDLTADVFTTAWRKREQLPVDLELPWLYKTASYVLANHRRKPTLTLIGDPGRPEQHSRQTRTEDPADLVIEDDHLRRALLTLRPRDRQVLLMHAWEGLDGAQLAAALGLSRGGAAAALSRARARFRDACATD